LEKGLEIREEAKGRYSVAHHDSGTAINDDMHVYDVSAVRKVRI